MCAEFWVSTAPRTTRWEGEPEDGDEGPIILWKLSASSSALIGRDCTINQSEIWSTDNDVEISSRLWATIEESFKEIMTGSGWVAGSDREARTSDEAEMEKMGGEPCKGRQASSMLSCTANESYRKEGDEGELTLTAGSNLSWMRRNETSYRSMMDGKSDEETLVSGLETQHGKHRSTKEVYTHGANAEAAKDSIASSVLRPA
jgi:hypothetical protein